jgi:hypothetical protein
MVRGPLAATILEPGIRDGKATIIPPGADFIDIQQYRPVDGDDEAFFETVRYEVMILSSGAVLLVHPSIVAWMRKG